MNQQASQVGTRFDLRQKMPKTAQWVDEKRQEMGADHVNACIRRAMKGEPGQFYAIEGGNVLGTPFPAGHPLEAAQQCALLWGCSFAGFIAEPLKGVAA